MTGGRRRSSSAGVGTAIAPSYRGAPDPPPPPPDSPCRSLRTTGVRTKASASDASSAASRGRDPGADLPRASRVDQDRRRGRPDRDVGLRVRDERLGVGTPGRRVEPLDGVPHFGSPTDPVGVDSEFDPAPLQVVVLGASRTPGAAPPRSPACDRAGAAPRARRSVPRPRAASRRPRRERRRDSVGSRRAASISCRRSPASER